MAITPGNQFEPPYVGFYNQRVHGEGDPFASARSGQELRFHNAPPAMFPSPWGRGTKGEGKRRQRMRKVSVVKQRADRCSLPRLYPLETSRNHKLCIASRRLCSMRRGFHWAGIPNHRSFPRDVPGAKDVRPGALAGLGQRGNLARHKHFIFFSAYRSIKQVCIIGRKFRCVTAWLRPFWRA